MFCEAAIQFDPTNETFPVCDIILSTENRTAAVIGDTLSWHTLLGNVPISRYALRWTVCVHDAKGDILIGVAYPKLRQEAFDPRLSAFATRPDTQAPQDWCVSIRRPGIGFHGDDTNEYDPELAHRVPVVLGNCKMSRVTIEIDLITRTMRAGIDAMPITDVWTNIAFFDTCLPFVAVCGAGTIVNVESPEVVF